MTGVDCGYKRKSKPATRSAVRWYKYRRAALDHGMSSSGRDNNARVDFLVGNLFFAVGGRDQRRCWSCDFSGFSGLTLRSMAENYIVQYTEMDVEY